MVLSRIDGAVLAFDMKGLVALAQRFDCVIELIPEVGQFVAEGDPLFRVYQGGEGLTNAQFWNSVAQGEERTPEQDPLFAFRILVDIANKALSPAINDPTTAVQTLDQIEDLLIRLGRRRLEIGAFRDGRSSLRLFITYPAWEDFLRLALDEIRFYCASSVQVMRRMTALVSELISILPEERCAALVDWRERLQSTVERSFHDAKEKLDASVEDRQGLGSSRRRDQKGAAREPVGDRF
jgi:uncharacterized membrane protein